MKNKEEWFQQELKKYEKDPEVILQGMLFDISEKVFKIIEANEFEIKNISKKKLNLLYSANSDIKLRTIIEILAAVNCKLLIEIKEEGL